MDARLLAWARRVKARGSAVPLWLFTDPRRLPDPLAAIAALPRGLCGVVLRPPMPEAQARAIAALCRRRRLALSVAGDWRLAARLHAGLHLRGGRLPGPAPRWLPRATASAHNRPEVLRARLAGACLVFVSPTFATASHPGTRGLGPSRWAVLARPAGRRAAALGGIEAGSLRRLSPSCGAIGAIGALAPREARG